MTRALPAAAATFLAATLTAAQEVHFSNEEFKRLDTFEAHSLTRADGIFNRKEYRAAAAEYDSFIMEFEGSKAVPYALLRKGRCLQLDHKRFEAVKVYREVLDYFPNAVGYAAAALFCTGQCHRENGDVEKAMKAWAKMADDVDYSKHFLAASAVNGLADNLVKRGEHAKAVRYYRQVALDFRASNRDASRYAIGKVIRHHLRTKPDEPRLREFYEKARTFDERPRRIDGKPEESRAYWDSVRGWVRRLGQFDGREKDARGRYYAYWAKALEGRFADWDDLRIDVADFRRAADGDVAGWIEALDRQFEEHRKPGDYARVVRWIRLYREHDAKLAEYYAKLRFDEMENEEIRELVRALFDAGRDGMAANAFFKIRLAEMEDGTRVGLAREVWRAKDSGPVEAVCASMEDRGLGRMELLRYLHSKTRRGGPAGTVKRAVALADDLSHPDFAGEAVWLKAEILEGQQRWLEAIVAYQQADNPPDNLWRIAGCYARAGKLAQAVAQLREVENFFRDHAAEAVLRIAHLYRDARKKPEQIAALREIMKKYPKSGQSRQAHVELEGLGARIGGAVDAE